ncbi:hypothetical protein ZIOFF_041510 [Zingiber officinale]|uniref:Peptidase M16 C-terminal domain-containing protein n=1 Tax=Zingiber officinale TaxID=94328 RepID=A0A8J5L1N7_ZINOF|nr:hypothetical protein ZIOFF_041510 [Zingiber officinale]
MFQKLMGGGGSFSAGGPGKGMQSRLYINVLSQFPQLESFSAFNSRYNHTGLFGIQATCVSSSASSVCQDVVFYPYIVNAKLEVGLAGNCNAPSVVVHNADTYGPDFTSKAVDLAARELLAVAIPGQAILMNLESKKVSSEDIGRQILTYGERKPVEHFLKAIDQLTLKDIVYLAETLISSPLTLASWGDVIRVPSYESVSRKFHSK